MRNNLVRNLAGVASDTRRIKDHRAVITLGCRRAIVFPFIFLLVFFFLFLFLFADLVLGGFLVDLPSSYLRPHEKTGVILRDNHERAKAKTAITSCRLIV